MASYPAEPKGSPAAGGPEAKFDNPASIHSHPMHPDDNVTTRTVQCVEPGCTLRAVPGGGNLCSRHRPRQPKNPRPRNKCTHPGCTRPQAFVGDTCAQTSPGSSGPTCGPPSKSRRPSRRGPRETSARSPIYCPSAGSHPNRPPTAPRQRRRRAFEDTGDGGAPGERQ